MLSSSHALQYAHEATAGQEYEPLSFVVTAEMNQQFLFALDDFDERFVHRGDWGEPIVHPVILLHMSARTRSPSFRLPSHIGSVFAKDDATFRAPGRVDERFSVTWKILDVYEKRGRVYQSLQTTVCNDRKIEVLSRNSHSVFYTKGPAAPVEGKTA